MSDGEASKDKDKVLLEYLHYKHYDQETGHFFLLKLVLDITPTLLFHIFQQLFLRYIYMDHKSVCKPFFLFYRFYLSNLQKIHDQNILFESAISDMSTSILNGHI